MNDLNVIKQNEIKTRESNIELLRIFSMFFIVLFHFALHGVVKYYGINNTLTEHFNNCFTSFLLYGGKLGVDIFILITGYFMINSSLKLKHFFKIYILTIIYSWIFLMIAFFIGSHEIDSVMFRRGLFPVLGGSIGL